MAAYASLISLMKVIHDLEHHPSPPIFLDKQLVDSITQRITYFQEFLHSYISSSPVADDDEEVANPLEMRIAAAAFAAEDAIEYHIVDCINHKKKKKKANDDEKAKSLNRCYDILQSVIEEMDSIKKVVEDTQKIKKVPLVHDQVGTTNATPSVADRSETYGVLIEIMEKLVGGQLDFQVIPIVGMGGIGKTFLAKTIYTKPLIKERFDICAWATISQHYNTRKIRWVLWELLFQATKTNKEQQSGKSVDELGLELRKYLFGRRFLIVMDDMWSIDLWDQIQRFFPNNGNGSRVLVTTRLSQLSSQFTTDYSLSMSFLDNVTASVADRSETLVGSDGVLIEIMEKLAGGQLDFQVIPIVGMGGIGKTFLAKTIYTKPLIKERFDICTWATISQNYDTKQILCELLFQANKEQQSVDELGSQLHKNLFGRRFLIVMDDMWSIDSWDQIQRFFPNNCNGSRVLVTTRLSQLSSQLTTNYSLNMSFLDKASSWDLFSKTVFGEKSSCPPELEEIGEKIVDNCRGLPLSISVVGGLLKNMDDTRSWESIRDNFTSVVNMRDDKHCLRLLKLSYNHLPVYLKPCFLYMGVFEEDERICVSKLVLQWVSEGFLKPTEGEALEITGRGFLEDLVGRNLILIDKLGITGSIKYCKIHDLVRDMCLKEGQKEGFYQVMGKCNHPSSQGMIAQRRVIIPDNTLKEHNVRSDLRLMSHTRSIICEYGRVPLCKNLVLLRTLQMYNKFSIGEMKIGLNSVVSRYVNLRHLAIAASWMPPFLPSISHLWNLRTLVVCYFFVVEPILVVDFWEMTQLRHMSFLYSSACLPDPPSCNGKDGDAVVIMENLHTLKGIRNFKFREGVVKRIPNIKKLGLEYKSDDVDLNDEDNDDVYFLGNMKYLCGLESLSVFFSSASRLFTLLQKITYPHSLKKLSLRLGSEHEWDDDMLEKIGSLPLLEKLRLRFGCFKKGKWEIGQGQFPCLKYLEMTNCRGLENWSAVEEESSILPRLEHLHLEELRELKKIPIELGNIDTLKSIKMDLCGEGAVKSAKEMFDEQVELQGGEDQLSFHVQVRVKYGHQHLMSLASSNFYVSVW